MLRQKEKIYFIFFVASVLLANINFVKAEIIFGDNFDSQADWKPAVSGQNDLSPGGSSNECGTFEQADSCIPKPPLSWSYYRDTGLWWEPNYNSSIRISSLANRIAGQENQQGQNTGKSYIQYNEANMGAAGDGWGADGQLNKMLSQNYPELYISFWIYYQPGWKWDTLNDMMVKTVRVQHNDNAGTGSVFSNFSTGYNAPIALYLFKHSNTYGTRAQYGVSCEPKIDNYHCDKVSGIYGMYDKDGLLLPSQGSSPLPNSPGEPADVNWHKYLLHVKMNTFQNDGVTPNADGIMEFSYDSNLLYSRTDIMYLGPGSDPTWGWNNFSIGGNSFNNYNDTWNSISSYLIGSTVVRSSHNFTAIQANTNQAPVMGGNAYWADNGLVNSQIEQWYAIDDVVVSTTPIPDNYVIGSSIKFSFSDFSTLISSWLKKVNGNTSDLNSDNIVNTKDLGIMMSKWN